MVSFSRRVPADLRPSALARERERMGEVPFDLSLSNPTACGLPYPPRLLDALADPRALRYRPDPLGERRARVAIAAQYRRWGLEVPADHLVLTASTSEAYGLLFRVLLDPDDTVLVPTPSYPLLEHLARLEGVGARPYRLDPEADWRVDPGSLPTDDSRVRALVIVHPNNPTGTFVHPEDARSLQNACSEQGWALVADEVFLPFPLTRAPGWDHSFAGTDRILTFSLGGLSKSLGLPQLKLSWIVVSGPPRQVEEALDRLAWAADAYLSVGAPVACAAPRLLQEGAPVQRAIADRCTTNLGELLSSAAALPEVTVREPAGGWSAIVRFPAVMDEERLALELLREDGVAIHPGYLFDLPGRGHLVLSLLPEPAEFAEGVRRLLARLRRMLD